MTSLDINAVRDFYNSTPEIWAPDDDWHQWSYKVIYNYLSAHSFSTEEYVLNAGSGGNSYGINANMVHVDIAEEKLKGIENAVISNVEKMPFPSAVFDGIICVGSVINYCDASAAITEFSRVLKSKGRLILEFESSAGYEYKGTSIYEKSADIVTVQFQGQDHNQWLYSPPYMRALLSASSFKVKQVFPFQILSSLVLHLNGDEKRSVKYARYDVAARKLPLVAAHANNIILNCQKL